MRRIKPYFFVGIFIVGCLFPSYVNAQLPSSDQLLMEISGEDSKEIQTLEQAMPIENTAPEAASVASVSAQEIEPMPVANSQASSNKYDSYYSGWSINLNGGSNLFYGDVRVYDYWPVKKYNRERKWAMSFLVERELASFVHLRAQVLYGTLSGTKREYANGSPANMYFDANLLEYNLNVKLSLLARKPFSIYGYVGVGAVHFGSELKNLNTDESIMSYGVKDKKEMALTVPLGIGLDYKITPSFSVNLDLAFNIVATDKLDAVESNSEPFLQDMFSYTSIGVTYRFGAKKKVKKTHPTVVPVEPIEETIEEVIEEDAVEPDVDTTTQNVLNTQNNAIESSNNIVEEEVVAPEVIEEKENVQEEVIAEKEISTSPIVKFKEPEPVTNTIGYVYRIQVNAVKQTTKDKIQELQGLYGLEGKIYEEKVDGWFKYSVGSFDNIKEARKYKNELVNKGAEGSFIILYKDGVRVPLSSFGK